MENEDANSPLESRIPTLEDLLFLCRSLNEAGAKYIVIGGWAVIQQGFDRTTSDIDLLVDSSPENFEKIRTAMLKLPDGAIREVESRDLDKFIVVRVADEFVVDLMKRSCGIEYSEAGQFVESIQVRDVTIPFANLELLLRTKQTYREKDALDRAFIEERLKQRRS
jgi:predicted nucleotidyltransferase